MTVKEFLEKTFKYNEQYAIRPYVYCIDGFGISIQGGTHFHYCEPRCHTNEYYKVELGFPTQPEESIMPYAEDNDEPTETVYAYVPIETVEDMVYSHGGIVSFLNREGKFEIEKLNEVYPLEHYLIK